MSQKKLEDLEGRRQRKLEELEKLKGEIAKERKTERSKEEKKRTKQKILVGAYVFKLLEDGESVTLKNYDDLLAKLENFLTRNPDRRAFDFPVIEQDDSKPPAKKTAKKSSPRQDKKPLGDDDRNRGNSDTSK